MTDHPAPQSRSSAQSPVPAEFEPPSSKAELHISLEPVEFKTAHVTIPPHQARYYVETLGILGSIVAGTSGAVLTLRLLTGNTGVAVAVAELALALIAAVLIVVVARAPGKRSS